MYVKLFSSLYTGSLRGKSDCILVFTNLLAHADSTGIADVHPRAVADEVGLSLEEVRTAIRELESEDKDSRSPEENGKRLVLLDSHRDWGWQIVNFAKYRSIKNEEERREQNRAAQERFRSKQRNHESADVSSVSQSKPKQKQKQKQKNNKNTSANDQMRENAGFEKWWEIYPRKKDKLDAKKAYQKAVAEIADRSGISTEAAESVLLSLTEERLPILAATESQYVKYPATWLSHGCYEDEIEIAYTSRVATAEDLKSWTPD